MTGKKKLLWYNLALMAFTGVWSFGNIINGFAVYGGVRAVIPWLIIFGLYFVPYSLMVGELGSAFSSEGAGVSAWIGKTIGPAAAYMAGWMYWVVHMPYISQKPSKIIIACGWAFFKDGRAQNMPPYLIAIISLAIFALAVVMALRGMDFLKKISGIAGAATFILSLMYIVMMFVSQAIVGSSFGDISLSLSTYKPEINLQFFLSMSILIFAVGGCEKVSPYVNRMRSPGKDFPIGMVVLAIMTTVSALFGTIAMGMMFDSNNIPKDLITNGGYYAFQMLGRHYGMGDLLMIVYAVCEFITQLTVIIISIDAPLKMLLDNADRRYIPENLFKKNENGVYVNGVKMVAVIVGILIVIPVFGIGEMNDLVIWLVKINSVCMPMRYLWVFAAYIALKALARKENLQAEYHFIKNPTIGKAVGGWCFLLTFVSCVMGIYSKNRFELIMNMLVPTCLIGLGFIMPHIAKRKKRKR
ncbi:MAG: amino acid permease [Synergistes sp.]|nr:amino acid permease [Synergistes sp.]